MTDKLPAQHDPPFDPDSLKISIDLPPERLAQLSGVGFEKYVLMRERLGGQEPLKFIAVMRRGGYRYKSKRGAPGVLVLDRDGSPVPDLMSFRQIAPIMEKWSGVPVTYETVRRWWEIAFPDEQPEESLSPDDVNGPTEEALREVSDIVVKAGRRRKAPPVGDDHADAIRVAVERARAATTRTTNPDVPSAVFLPPDTGEASLID